MGILPIVLSFLLIAVDQVVKYITVLKLKQIDSIEVIENFFYLTYVENRGAAFGILHGARWIFIVSTIVIIFFLVKFYKNIQKNKFEIVSKISVVFIISGAIGNFIDRLFRGFVVDTFNFIIFGYDFPVFNVADICVCLGALLLCIALAFSEDESKEKENVTVSEAINGNL